MFSSSPRENSFCSLSPRLQARLLVFMKARPRKEVLQAYTPRMSGGQMYLCSCT